MAPEPEHYDDAEALDLLSRFADEIHPDESARAAAAKRLLQDLAALGSRTRFKITKQADRDIVIVALGRYAAVVAHGGYGSFFVGERLNGPGQEVPLAFNERTGLLESSRADSYRSAKAGEGPRRRSALAEVVEAAVAVIRAQVAARRG